MTKGHKGTFWRDGNAGQWLYDYICLSNLEQILLYVNYASINLTF